MNDTTTSAAYVVADFKEIEPNYFEHGEAGIELKVLPFSRKCEIWGYGRRGIRLWHTVTGGVAEAVAHLNKPLPVQTFSLENCTQGYSDLCEGTTKAEAIAAYRAQHPGTKNDTLKAYVSR